MKSIRAAMAILILSTMAGCAQRAARAIPGGQAVADFDSRVNAYAEFRDRMEKGAARLDETAKPEEIAAAEKALATKIQEARSTAKRGDIFTPAVQRGFRVLLNRELRGVRGQNTRGSIRTRAQGLGVSRSR